MVRRIFIPSVIILPAMDPPRLLFALRPLPPSPCPLLNSQPSSTVFFCLYLLSSPAHPIFPPPRPPPSPASICSPVVPSPLLLNAFHYDLTLTFPPSCLRPLPSRPSRFAEYIQKGVNMDWRRKSESCPSSFVTFLHLQSDKKQ
jgi:hypothetical protein